jgi:hypothetical protein
VVGVVGAGAGDTGVGFVERRKERKGGKRLIERGMLRGGWARSRSVGSSLHIDISPKTSVGFDQLYP